MSRAPLSVFITGIAGFIGFHLASFLAKRGDYVIGCDNFNDYYSPKLKKERAALLKKSNVEVIRCDIAALSTLQPLFQERQFSHCVHLAAQAGVRTSLTRPHLYQKSNLEGMLHVLEMCRAFQPMALLFASSSSVYGDAARAGPCSEKMPTDHPRSFYAATKKAGEVLAASYAHLYQIPTTVLRFFTTYGPWGRPDMACLTFAEAITAGKPVHLFNRGEMARDFTYIDDTVRGIVSAMDRCKKGYDLYNLGHGRCTSLLSLVQCLEKSLGKKARCTLLPMQPGDVTTTWADMAKTEKELNFTCTTPLERGIDQFVQWYLSFSSLLCEA